MPAKKKLLPRPCPQCGLENGGMQLVIFDPRFSHSYKYNKEKMPYVILRISHYSKEFYDLSPKTKKKNRTKIWHNFRTKANNEYLLESIFGTNYDKYDDLTNSYKMKCLDRFFGDRKSITISVSKDWINIIKQKGWDSFIDDCNGQANYISRGNLIKCDYCSSYSKKEELINYEFDLICLNCDLKKKEGNILREIELKENVLKQCWICEKYFRIRELNYFILNLYSYYTCYECSQKKR